jgi:hypothetical protein
VGCLDTIDATPTASMIGTSSAHTPETAAKTAWLPDSHPDQGRADPALQRQAAVSPE